MENMEQNLENQEQMEVTTQVGSKEQNEPTDDSSILQIKKEALDAILKKEYKRGRKKGAIVTGIIALLLVLIVTGINLVTSYRNGLLYIKLLTMGSGTLMDAETAAKVDQIYGLIENTYIEEADKEALRDGLYSGLLDSLGDVYSVYYNAEEYAEMMEASEGSFEGIGAYLSQDPDTMTISVVRPILDSPAEEVGIIAGDVLKYVDGEDISGQDLNIVVSKVRGEAGTTVNIGIIREGHDEPIYFDITRRKVDSVSCEGEMLDNNIGYIYITEFADATDEQFIKHYDRLVEEGMTSLIIDLRSNGGGYVDTSVEIADKLVKDGVIVTIKDRHGSVASYEDRGDENYTNIPCVVLVDGNTASASEILTGALKDYNIATIMGTQTFGKGIVQDILPLADGSGVKLTSSKYYTPDGYNIHGVGIEPDIIVEFDSEKYVNEGIDNQLEAAKNYLLTGLVESNE